MKNLFTYLLLLLTVLGIGYAVISIDPFSTTQDGEIVKQENNQDVWSTKKSKVKSGPEAFMKPDGFIRYFNQAGKPIGAEKSSYKPGYRFSEIAKSKQVLASRRGLTYQNAEFISRGPGNVGGRTRAIAVDPEDNTNCTWIAGAASGGIWKTEDCGNTWVNISPDLPNLSTNSIAQAASNPEIIYVGTGEVFGGNSTFVRGNGIYKSTDRGANWSLLPSTINNTNFISVNRIQVDPANPDIVVIATNNGIYKSIDGGSSWDLKASFEGSDDGRVQDLQVDPTDYNIMYAGVNSSGIYKSTDAGDTWTASSNGIGEGIRFEIAVAPSNTDVVYTSSYVGQTTILYYSNDAGQNWYRVEDNDYNTNFLGGQGWYDNTVAVNPYNENEVFVGGVSMGKFEILTDAFIFDGDNNATGIEANAQVVYDAYGGWEGQNSNNLHPDHHHLTLIKTDDQNETFMIVNGNDGGLGISTDNGEVFAQITDGYITTQFYGADKKPGEDKYIGGTQDNGTWVSTGTSVDSTNAYNFVIGGDGFEVLWHPTKTDLVLGSIYNNRIQKSTNGGQSFSPASSGISSGDGPFITRLAHSPKRPDVVFAIGGGGVYKSRNFGDSWSLKSINSDFWGGNASFSDVEVSLSNPDIVWAGAGMADGALNFFVSTDGGENFEAVSNYGNGLFAYSTGIYTHPSKDSTAFALFSIADAPKILKTEDLGETWTDISGFAGGSGESTNGFPNVYTHSLLVMPFNEDIIWAGTEIGLYESLDGGASWNLRDDFPSVSIWSMKIVDDQVVLGTHGRGIWTASMQELLPTTLTTSNFTYQGYGNATVDVNLPIQYDSIYLYADDELKATNLNPSVGNSSITIEGFQNFSGSSLYITGYKGGTAFESLPIIISSINVRPEILATSSEYANGTNQVTVELENNEPFDSVEVIFGADVVYTDYQQLNDEAIDSRVIEFTYDEFTTTKVKTNSYINGQKYISFYDVDLVTSNKQLTNDEFVIYPVPANNYFQYNESNVIIEQIKLYSQSGQLLKKVTTNEMQENRVDLSDLPSGIILIQAESDNGALMTTKILKK